MKKIIACCFLTFSCLATYAQPTDKVQTDVVRTPYQSMMDGLLTKMKAANSADAFEAVAKGFEGLAKKETSKWHPHYYAAYSIIMQTMNMEEKSLEIDDMLLRADDFLAKAKKLSNKQDEILVLTALSKLASIAVAPEKRNAEYGREIVRLLAEAEKINPTNPRISLLQGLRLIGTPQEYGGGKEAAKPEFEKALMFFQRERGGRKMEEFSPSWGEEQCTKIFAEYTK